MSEERWADCESLRESTLKTAKAWAIKEAAMEIWSIDATPVLQDASRNLLSR